MSDGPVWLDAQEIVAINGLLVARFGGFGGGIRDEGVLQAAVARPLNKWHYEEGCPDLFDLAAACCFGLVRGHPFTDGNKRTAYVAAITFLALNDVACVPAQADIVITMTAAAAGDLTEAALAAWFRKNAPA